MGKKDPIKKKFLLRREKKYFELNENFLNPLSKIIKKIYGSAKINISLYFPTNFEANILKIFDNKRFKKYNFLLPIVKKNTEMNFYRWKKNDILFLNKYGVPEPIKSNRIIPNVALVPLLAFDKNKNRLGYGKGFYDKYFNRYIKIHNKILTVGIAFSFQKYPKLPVNKKDYKLNYILTDKGIK